jgi:hypothetical protein
MISKGDLETVFQAWYDYKMEPDDPELLRVHRATMNHLTAKNGGISGSSDYGGISQTDNHR